MNSTATTTFNPYTMRALDDIIRDAHRMTPEELADIIRDARWHGTPTEPAETAVGNYLAEHLLLARVALAVTVWVQHHTATVLCTRTRRVLARAEITGGLAELRDLIDENADGFADLHDPTETVPEPLGAADHAELAATATLDDLFTTDDDPEFFDYITAMAESIAV